MRRSKFIFAAQCLGEQSAKRSNAGGATGRRAGRAGSKADSSRAERDRFSESGFFVGFGFSSDAEREGERFWKQSKRVIKLLRVQEILDEEIAQKMA